MAAAKAAGQEILYTDECLFTRRTVQPAEWSHRRTNLELDLGALNEPAYALVLAVSADRGVVAWKTYKKSVNVTKWLNYIEVLRENTGERPACLFWDNLAVHRSKTVLDRLDEVGIHNIFNLLASPDFNGVEGCFSKIKQSFKTQRAQKLARGMRPNIETLIHRAVKSLTLKDI